MNTRLIYLYRDGSNYKQFGSVLLEGEISTAEAAAIRSRCDAGEMFVTEQVGLPSLHEGMVQCSGPSSEDHGWHELVSLEVVDGGGLSVTTVADMVGRFADVGAWRPSRPDRTIADM